MNHQAIYSLYPSVISVDDTEGAKDANRNSVAINMVAVEQEAGRMEAEAEAQAEAKAQLRSSVINKIATNLTSEEKLWLEENL